MELQVILDEARDEKVRMIVTFLHTQRQRNTFLFTSAFQCPRFQLFLQEVVTATLVHEDSDWRAAVLFHKFHCIIRLPAVLINPKIKGESLLPPWALHGVSDGRKGGDGMVHARVFQCDCDSTMAAHAVPHDTNFVMQHGQASTDKRWQFHGNVIQHVVVLLVFIGCGIEVETGTFAKVKRFWIFIRHIITPGGRIGNDEDEAELASSFKSTCFLREILICTGEATEPKYSRKFCALCCIWQIDSKFHNAVAKCVAYMLEALELPCKTAD
mmetsp:Transcript_59777/g.118439  ORF Transcript_59777/g.118439 Transcript_59777/m.118439 type:complete len:270 (-) Transcript_59777:81-890(-)